MTTNTLLISLMVMQSQFYADSDRSSIVYSEEELNQRPEYQMESVPYEQNSVGPEEALFLEAMRTDPEEKIRFAVRIDTGIEFPNLQGLEEIDRQILLGQLSTELVLHPAMLKFREDAQSLGANVLGWSWLNQTVYLEATPRALYSVASNHLAVRLFPSTMPLRTSNGYTGVDIRDELDIQDNLDAGWQGNQGGRYNDGPVRIAIIEAKDYQGRTNLFNTAHVGWRDCYNCSSRFIVNK